MDTGQKCFCPTKTTRMGNTVNFKVVLSIFCNHEAMETHLGNSCCKLIAPSQQQNTVVIQRFQRHYLNKIIMELRFWHKLPQISYTLCQSDNCFPPFLSRQDELKQWSLKLKKNFIAAVWNVQLSPLSWLKPSDWHDCNFLFESL